MRLFIAIELSSEIKKNIIELIEILKEKGEGVKWVRPDGIHLTLKFLGETPPSRIQEINASIQKSVRDFSPFHLSFRGTGYFPPGKKPPRVLWIGVSQNKSLKEIQENLETNLEEIGYPKEKREFIPHLTLGRVKFPSKLGLIKEELEKYKNQQFGEMQVKKINLFQSILKKEGAEYITLANFNL